MYDFKDTVQQTDQEAVQKLAEAMSLDGAYIEDNIPGYRTLSVSGRESLSYDVTDTDRPVGMDGKEYYGKSMPERNLVIKFQLTAGAAVEFMNRYRSLKKFCSGENREIRFADEPNAHYLGTLIEVESPDAGVLSVVSEMTFYCADPYLIADNITTVAAADENGILTANVNNDGSGQAYPTYRIVHASENGYLGIVHAGGAFEMGNRDEADQEEYKRSEMLTLLSDIASLTDDHGTNYMHPNHVMGGSLSVETISGRQCLKLNSTGTETSGMWCGGMKTLTIKADSNGDLGSQNFDVYLNDWFQSGLNGQTGEQSIAFLADDNVVICGYSIYKADMTGNTANLEFWANGKIIRSIAFMPTMWAEHNPFCGSSGHNMVRKEGEKLTFYWGGSYINYTVPAVKDMKCTKVQVAFTQYQGRGLGNAYLSYNSLRDFKFSKLNVDKWNDVPNRYPTGSEVGINTSDDSITINGLTSNDELVTGSVFASLPTGNTKIRFYTSPWCKQEPSVTVEYRKRWL